MEPTDLKGLKFPEKKSNNPATLICGHGGELCNNDGSLQILDIPEKCMLITFADCGLVNFALDIYKLIIKNKDNLEFFENPIKYKDNLEKLFNRKIHIHHANAENKTSKTYVNTQYRLIGNVKDTINCRLQLSGLIPLQNKYLNQLNIHTLQSSVFDCKDKFPASMYFKGSIFPTDSYIDSLYYKGVKSIPELVDKIPIVTQSFLFKHRPGIYFNPLCRVNNCRVKDVLTRQYESSRAINKNLNTDMTYIKNMISNCIEEDDCTLFENKASILDKLEKSVLHDIRDYIISRSKHFNKIETRNYINILTYLDSLITEKYINGLNDHNDFRTIHIANRPKKHNFNYNLVTVGSGKRRKTVNKRKTYKKLNSNFM